jgi:Chemotaxis response regulator containing a CheY-like receiver domain and a methylesterase domain
MTLNQRQLLPGERIRVLVVDDSVVVRRLVSQALQEDPSMDVVATASNGTLALQRMSQLNPDVVILDIEMPEMDGLEVLRHIRRDYRNTRVIMFSTLTERGANVTFEALALGADDYVAKTNFEASSGSPGQRIQQYLIAKIKQFYKIPGDGLTPASQLHIGSATRRNEPLRHAFGGVPKAVAIGVSTGGPNALATILPQLPSDFPLPVLVVQHMPPIFTRLLAERLNRSCKLQVEEAVHGKVIHSGEVLIAPGDFHMRVAAQDGSVSVVLDQSPPQNYCRPAVDVLFRSTAEVYGGSVIAVVLTGMGQDGLRGVETLKAQGASVLAQDEASSVVWGMPGAIAASGLADRILPLHDVVPEILRMAGRN